MSSDYLTEDNQVNRKILGAYNPACLLSLAGVFAAVGTMIFSVQGTVELALVCLILAGLADLFDGVVARRLRLGEYENEFGVQLDTTVDAVAFIAAPVVIALSLGSTSWPVVLGVAWFVLAGVLRLSHFSTLSALGVDQSTHHRGLPVTYIALILPLLFLARDGMAAADFHLLLGLTLAVVGLLFVINVPVPKPRGMFYVILPLLAAGLIAHWVERYLQFSASL